MQIRNCVLHTCEAYVRGSNSSHMPEEAHKNLESHFSSCCSTCQSKCASCFPSWLVNPCCAGGTRPWHFGMTQCRCLVCFSPEAGRQAGSVRRWHFSLPRSRCIVVWGLFSLLSFIFLGESVEREVVITQLWGALPGASRKTFLNACAS